MAKNRDLGKDKFGVQRVMRRRDYLGDSLGQFALNAMSGLVGQLTYFYTDKVGLAAGAVATLFLITKIIDAFTDILMGNIVDHTKPGRERYRPWLLKAGIPSAIFTVLLFTVPKAGQGLQLAYMLVTNLLFTAVFYTAVCIPYVSLQVVRTNSQEERGAMGTWRAAAGYVSGMIIAIAIIPVTNMLGGTQSAWVKVSAVFGALILLAFLLCYKSSKETPTAAGQLPEQGTEQEEGVPFREALGKLFQNKYWVIVLLVNFFVNILYGLSSSAGTYYCKWIYGNDNLVGILGAIGLIPTLLGFLLIGPMIKKLGVTKTLKISFVIGAAANALRIVNPSDFIYNTALGCFSTFANIPAMCLTGVLMAMAIDYNEFKFGRRMVGSSGSAGGFGGKVGSGIGASLVGWCLAAAGYNGLTMTTADMATRIAIYTFSIYIPMVMYFAMFLLTCRFDLEARLPGIREETAKRKAAQTSAE